MRRFLKPILFIGLLFLFLSCSAIGTADWRKQEESEPTMSRFILKWIDNVNCLSDEEFKKYVEEVVCSERWIEIYGIPVNIRYEKIERLHITYLVAWVYYNRKSKIILFFDWKMQ